MRHALNISHIVLLGGFSLFTLLFFFTAVEWQFTGHATAGSRVNITSSGPANCTVIAGSGLNTISFPCLSTSTLLGEVVNGSGIIAMYQYLPGESDQWAVFNPNLPSWVVSDLQYLSRRNGYLLLVNETKTMSIQGLSVFYTDIPLVQGWNLVGYPSLSVKNVSTSFSSISATLRQARTYNNTAGAYIIYNNPGGSLTTTDPGQAYWLNVSSATTWTVLG